MDETKLFDAQYPELLSRVKATDLSRLPEKLEVGSENGLFVFPFFNRKIMFDGAEFLDSADEIITPAVKVLLCRYLLSCPGDEAAGGTNLVTFRELAGGGPLFSRFAANTSKIIQTGFSGRVDLLRSKSLGMEGDLMDDPSWDLSVRFMALPRIPIILKFNDADELMPASAGFLYRDTALHYLDLQGLAVTCTYLTGCLIDEVR